MLISKNGLIPEVRRTIKNTKTRKKIRIKHESTQNATRRDKKTYNATLHCQT